MGFRQCHLTGIVLIIEIARMRAAPEKVPGFVVAFHSWARDAQLTSTALSVFDACLGGLRAPVLLAIPCVALPLPAWPPYGPSTPGGDQLVCALTSFGPCGCRLLLTSGPRERQRHERVHGHLRRGHDETMVATRPIVEMGSFEAQSPASSSVGQSAAGPPPIQFEPTATRSRRQGPPAGAC